jgi:hypothetical protein
MPYGVAAGKQDENRAAVDADKLAIRFATGSPRPVVMRIRKALLKAGPSSRQVSWLTAAKWLTRSSGRSRSSRLPARAVAVQ